MQLASGGRAAPLPFIWDLPARKDFLPLGVATSEKEELEDWYMPVLKF